MTAEDAAAELGVVKRTVYRFIDEGTLRAYKMGRVIRVRRSDLDEFIASREIKPGELTHLWRGPDTRLSPASARRRPRRQRA